jgi:WXG100 family type VII secretion target
MALTYLIADSVREQMAAITEQVRSTLDELESQIGADVVNWSGSAQAAYAAHRANWAAAAEQMSPALGRAEAALAEVSGGYFRAGSGI